MSILKSYFVGEIRQYCYSERSGVFSSLAQARAQCMDRMVTDVTSMVTVIKKNYREEE